MFRVRRPPLAPCTLRPPMPMPMRLNRSQRLLVLCCALGAAIPVVSASTGHTAHPAAAAATAGASATTSTTAWAAPGRARGYLPRRLLVGFTAGAAAMGRRALAAVGARAVGRAGPATVASLGSGADPEEAAARLAAQPGIAFAAPDYLRAAHGCGDCWQLGPGEGQPGSGRFGTGAATLHAAGRLGRGSAVAVLDSGVADVPDLAGRVVDRRSCLPGPGGARCTRDGGTASLHGTMVASLIAASDDGQGITGIAPAARIKSWQVDGGGDIPSSAIIAALEEATADPEIGIVNMSFGGPAFSAAELAAVRRALAAGKTLVASAGNDGSYQPQYPAAYTGVVAVGATDAAGRVAAFSSYGKVDLVAPGVCLPAATPRPVPAAAGCPGRRTGGVTFVSGTSFAAPLVSGVLALRRAATPLRDRLGLAGTAAPPPAACAGAAPCQAGADERKRQGHGIVDAAAWDASFAPGAGPYLVVEAEPQLVRAPAVPSVTWRAYLLRSGGALPAPGPAGFAGLVPGRAGFIEAEPGAWLAELRGDPIAHGPGSALETVTAAGMTATTATRLLRPDDQAPGVPLAGEGPWLLRDSLQGGGTGPAATADLDDVRVMRLRAGQTIRVELRGPPRRALGAALFAPGTTDVLGRLDQIVASTGRPDARGVARLAYTVRTAGDWLLDVYAQGLESDAPASGRYVLTVSIV